MKIKILAATFLCIIFSGTISAQDNSTLAQNAYLKAEEYFAQNEYGKALTQLSEAETYLGATNPKILYLKINILKAQFSRSSSYYNSLTVNIKQFFSITDRNTYPVDKYMEIVRLQSDLADFVRADSVASNRLLASGDLSDIKSYLTNTPNTFFVSKLSAKRAELQKIQDEVDARQQIDTRLAELQNEISNAKGKSFSRRFWGSFGFVGGGAIAIAAFTEPTSDDESGGETILKPVLGGIGIAACAMGAVYMIGGNHREVKRLKNERNELLQRKKQLSFHVEPYYKQVLAHNTFGLNLKVSF